ncbi:hypothetical protein MKEN_00438200 [Mycena kentingensis (nom. inval.)]|nr:hypothetical protein MKEN_00438200 [Mycena kentingensis (nom. inval.)]
MPIPSFESQRRTSAALIPKSSRGSGVHKSVHFTRLRSKLGLPYYLPPQHRYRSPHHPSTLSMLQPSIAPIPKQRIPPPRKRATDGLRVKKRQQRPLEISCEELFTPRSRFPSRTLPFACSLPNLDSDDPNPLCMYDNGEPVFVRRFQTDNYGFNPQWSKWKKGTVKRYLPIRSFLGMHGHAYIVEVAHRDGTVTEDRYARYVGEICSPIELPHIDLLFPLDECASRREKAGWVYFCKDDSKVYSPGEILRVVYDAICGENVFWVFGILGMDAGTRLRLVATQLLPYSYATVINGRKWGMRFMGPDGEIGAHIPQHGAPLKLSPVTPDPPANYCDRGSVGHGQRRTMLPPCTVGFNPDGILLREHPPLVPRTTRSSNLAMRPRTMA